MKIKTVLIIVICLTASIWFWLWRTKVQKIQDHNTGALILPSSDNEKIVVDPSTHKITIINASGSHTNFLPDRPSSIEVRKTGEVVVTARQAGVEHALYFGGGFQSDNVRVCSGVDLLYYKRVDGGLFISDEIKDLRTPRIGVSLSYTVWHDTRLTLGFDNVGSPNVLITERF